MSKQNQKRLPKRKEIPQEYKWRLEDIYSSSVEWEKDFKWVRESLPRVAEYNGQLGQSAKKLLNSLSDYAAVMQKVEKLYVYAHMRKDEDNSLSESQALMDRAQALMVQYESTVSFLIPELLEIPNEKLQSFLKSCEGLKPYDHFIHNLIRQKDHVLSAREEEILAMAGEIASAPEQIYGMVNNADIRFPSIRDENGEEVELTKGRYIHFMENRDRRVRKDAFTTLYNTYGKQKNTIAATFNYNIKKDIFFSKMRKYPSNLEAALDSDNVPVSVYDNLIAAVENNMELMHRYVSLRKRALGLDELHMYDLYVPIVKDVEMKIPYQEAKKIVEDGLAPLGEEYTSILKEGFNNGWIDVMENEGKTSGAYSWGHYDTHPYVLLNYQPNVDNVFTIAHEMGHAIHTYKSNKAQPYITAGYKIFVAEVASTLNEILLTDYLLKNLKDKQQRAYILNHYLEQFRGTVYRQTMFAEFERKAHAMAENGEPLTVENLSNIYYDLNVKYYGTEMTVDREIALEWARIPHFYTSFYVYKYATGFSAAAALAQQILIQGDPAVWRYMDFLSSGGSDYPINLLKRAGVDITTPDPVNSALKTFGDMVAEMEKLI